MVGRCYPSFTTYRLTHPPAYQISIPSSIISVIYGSLKIKKVGIASSAPL